MVSDNPQTMATTLKEVYGIKGNDTTMHKEATEVRVKRDEDDVNEQVECFTLGLMTNSFSLESDTVVNFATGIVLPDDVAKTLVYITEKGRNQMHNFIGKRVNSSNFFLGWYSK